MHTHRTSCGEALVLTWLAAGGEHGLDTSSITMAQVASALDEPTPEDRVTALFLLLSE